MFPAKIPRLFVLASGVLLFLVTYTTFYLYHHGPAYPTTASQIVPAQDAARVQGEQDVGQHVDVAVGENDDNSVSVPVAGDNGDPTHESPVQFSDADGRPAQAPEVAAGTKVGEPASHNQHPLPIPNANDCPKDLQFLVRAGNDLELTERVRYTRRRIQPIFSNMVDRDEIANISEPLLQNTVEIDLYDCWDAPIPDTPPIKLQVPHPYPAETYPHLIFGIATDFERLDSSVPTFAFWLANTGAKLIAVVTDSNRKSRDQMDTLERKFLADGINATLVKPIDDMYSTSQNHFTVLIDMLEHAGPETQWYGLLDDDTFFPNLKPLSDGLAKLDHKSDAYVGALSEDFDAVRNFGFMAFGGAGAYISAPLAKTLGDQALKCINEATSVEGDIIIRDCVYRNSKAKLTILPGLYQQDMKEDASGFFEAGVRPITLHHWKSWYDEPVDKMAAAADFCGDCFLQRWRLGTDTLFTNGYSISTFRDGLDSVDLNLMEGTWQKANNNYDFSIGPLREALGPDRKRSFKLFEVEVMPNGDLKQLYVHANNPEMGELDDIVELIWEKQ